MFHGKTTSLMKFCDVNVTSEMTVSRQRVGRCVGVRARRCTHRTDEIDRCAIHDGTLLGNKPTNSHVSYTINVRYCV